MSKTLNEARMSTLSDKIDAEAEKPVKKVKSSKKVKKTNKKSK